MPRSSTSSAVSHGSKSGTSVQSATSAEPKPISPESGVDSPDSIDSNVVLPAPFGPTRPKTEPAGISRSTPSTPTPPKSLRSAVAV